MPAAPSNPYYRLLIVVSVTFVATVFAHALLPWASQPGWLQYHGWKILLAEVAGIIALGLASMGWDHAHDRPAGTAAPAAGAAREGGHGGERPGTDPGTAAAD